MRNSFKISASVKVAKIGRGILVKMTQADFRDVDAILKIAENYNAAAEAASRVLGWCVDNQTVTKADQPPHF